MTDADAPRIYLASPYTHEDPDIVEDRVNKVCRMAGDFLRDGMNVFSPIAHCHVIAKMSALPTDAGTWEDLNRSMIEVCDQLWVVMLDGWEKSVGIKREIEWAEELGLPVLKLQPQWEE